MEAHCGAAQSNTLMGRAQLSTLLPKNMCMYLLNDFSHFMEDFYAIVSNLHVPYVQLTSNTVVSAQLKNTLVYETHGAPYGFVT